MPHSLDVSRLQDVFDGLEENIEKLTKWEQNFLESVKDQWERNGTLSDSQLETLEKLWMKV
jgi:hypothetical protein